MSFFHLLLTVCANPANNLTCSPSYILLTRRTAAAAQKGAKPARRFSVFVSCRFPSAPGKVPIEPGALAQMRFVRAGLEALGICVLPLLDPGNVNRQDEIFTGIDECDLFIFFGTQTYGENTKNPMCSYYEFTHAQREEKPMAWIKMCERIDSPVVRAGLTGVIYKEWEETLALLNWLVAKIPGFNAQQRDAAAREGGTSSALTATPRGSASAASRLESPAALLRHASGGSIVMSAAGSVHNFHGFISYRRTHAEFGRSLKFALAQRGARCFLDIDSGDGLKAGHFQDQLESVLSDCNVVIAIVSPSPSGTDAVRRELSSFETIREYTATGKTDWCGVELANCAARGTLILAVYKVGVGGLDDSLETELAHLAGTEYAALVPMLRAGATPIYDDLFDQCIELVVAKMTSSLVDVAKQVALDDLPFSEVERDLHKACARVGSTAVTFAPPVKICVGALTGVHIFVSCRRTQLELGRAVKRTLEALGYSVFLDEAAEVSLFYVPLHFVRILLTI